jgi:hypothetical protein
MSRLALLAGCLAFALAGQVSAQCSSNRQNDELPALLENKTVCGTGVGANAGQKWQELHQGSGGGNLIEYAKGPTDPVDPSHVVGTWVFLFNNTLNRPNRVRYDYGDGGVYTWQVYDNQDGTYSFCTERNGTEIATATIQASGPCP